MKRKTLVILLLVSSALAVARPATAANAVVGTGSPGSCHEAAFANAVATVNPAGGTITFNCGGPATIVLAGQHIFFNSGNFGLTYTVDGGGVITLAGAGSSRLLLHASGTLNVQNITITGGRATGANDDASGAGIRSDGALLAGAAPVRLNLTNVAFTNNATNLTVAPTPPFSPFDYGGGALFTRFGIVTMNGCTFSGNVANNTSGGAVHIRSSTLGIVGSTFSGNSSNGGGFGGAMWADGLSSTPSGTGGTLQITTSAFSNNTSRNQGGAIAFYLYPEKNESVTLNYVSVIGNQVTDSSGTFLGTRASGGGIAGDRGNVTISNSTFANNVVRSNAGGGTGGGIALGSSGAVTIHNTTITNNRAEGSNADATGGGLVISGNSQPFDITHATIVFNFAQFTGGGLVSGSNGTLRNTIVANNDSAAFPPPGFDQCLTTVTNGGGVLEFPANSPPCASGAIVANPLIVVPMGANGGYTPTHLLQPASPAIDAGACVLPLDQRGIPRPQGPACDLGAVEMTVPGPASQFFTLPPCRRVDTRSGGPLACGANHTFTLTGGSCGVPSGAKAVAANVTVTQPSAPGNVNVFPASSSPPITAILNYGAGATRGNNAVVQLSAGGQVAVRCSPTGSAHVIIDINGYFQ